MSGQRTMGLHGIHQQCDSTDRPHNAYDGAMLWDRTIRELIVWDGARLNWFLGNGRAMMSTTPRQLSDDFRGSTIDSRYSLAKGSDGSAAYPALVAGDYLGEVNLVTGAGANLAANGSALGGTALAWKAADGVLTAEFRIKLAAITATELFLGFTDTLPASSLELPFTSVIGLTEAGDTGNAFSSWAFAGLSTLNSNAGVLYISYTAPESFPGTGTINVYKDAAKAHLVATGTGTIPATTTTVTITLTASNTSGLTGTVVVQHDAATNAAVTITAAETLTSNATDACGVLFETLSFCNWRAMGVANDVDATTADCAVTPTAATYANVKIVVSVLGTMKVYIDDVLKATVASAVTPSVNLVPVVVANSISASKTITLDWWHAK